MNLEESVTILATGQPSRYLFQREFAVAAFSGWVNSPKEVGSSTNTVFTALNRAVLHAKHNAILPPTEWLTEIFEPEAYINAMDMALCTPLFWSIEEFDGYNDCRYVADVVRFLLTFRSKDPDKRKRASLGKAWEFINKHGGYVRGNFGFGRKEWCSISSHQNLWRSFKTSGPFQCARSYGATLDWYIDPRATDYLEKLSAVAERNEDLINYFRITLDMQIRLKSVLDARSMSDDDYFKFPSSLSPLHYRLPPMSATAYGKMAAYRRSTNLSSPEWND